MNKEQILEEINKTERHLENMKKMLEECEYERWEPKENETFWYVDGTGTVIYSRYLLTDADKKLFKNYNCFQTPREAEQEVEKILVRRMLEDIARRLNKGEEIDWNDKYQCKFFLMIDFNQNNNLQLFEHYCVKYQGLVYCLDRNFKDVAIQEIGEERLITYLKSE